jgi:hypothetical protein
MTSAFQCSPAQHPHRCCTYYTVTKAHSPLRLLSPSRSSTIAHDPTSVKPHDSSTPSQSTPDRALLAPVTSTYEIEIPHPTRKGGFTIPSALTWHDDNRGTRTQLRRYTKDALATLERELWQDGHRRRSSPPSAKEVRCPSVRLAMLTFFFPSPLPISKGPAQSGETHLLWWDCICSSARAFLATHTLQPHTLESTLAGRTIVGGPWRLPQAYFTDWPHSRVGFGRTAFISPLPARSSGVRLNSLAGMRS